MREKELQKLKERKVNIEKKIAEGKRQQQNIKRKARTHALIVIAGAIFTEAVIAETKLNLSGYAENVKSRTGLERLAYLREGFGGAVECQERSLKATKTATTKTD